MSDSRPSYEAARCVRKFGEFTDRDALRVLGILIDGGAERKDLSGIQHALALGRELLESTRFDGMSAFNRGSLHFCLANAFDAVAKLGPSADRAAWDWHAEPLGRQVLHLRQALRIASSSDETSESMVMLRARVMTNLANSLSRVGRFVDAIALYDQARVIEPTFGMHAGNRGISIASYASAVPDTQHASFLLKYAFDAISESVRLNFDHESARDEMLIVLARVRRAVNDIATVQPDYSMGRSMHERAYRSWALRERLFLNPLNDVGEFPIATQDSMMPKSIVTRVSEGPFLFGLFNMLKQEYVSARFILYQGLHRKGTHFSDQQVKLSNTMDCSLHCLGTEEVKVAYRLAYSILDKVAHFVNAYFALGIKSKDVTFRGIWFADGKGDKLELHSTFSSLENWPMLGLFWMSKDIYDQRSEQALVLEPAAQDLTYLRHGLEHCHVKVVAYMTDAENSELRSDPTARMIITSDDLTRKALYILRFARAALIQLICGIASEESRRANGNTGRMLSMWLSAYNKE